jgi:HAD superfamily hydrolase (TIGR01509 family)
MSKVKLVIFDLDNTLVITKPAAKEGYKQAIYYLAKQHGLDRKKDKLYNHWKRLVQTLMGEHKPYLRRFAYSLQALMEEHKLPETYYSQALNTYEKVMLKNLKIQAGAKELITSLKEKKVKIAVTTGSDRSEAVKKLKSVELYSYIDVLVTANETEVMKPSPEYYKQVLAEINVPPEAAVVIGDNQQEDLDPAAALGMRTYLMPQEQNHLMVFQSEIMEAL